MTKVAGEARILEAAKKMSVKIITKKESNYDRTRKDKKVLPDRS